MAAPDRTHYDVLGIARDADAGTVRAAWKLHVQAWHPDRFSGEMRDKAEEHTVLINAAYNTLRDDSRRAAYDCRLAVEDAAARPEPEPRRASKVRPLAPRPAATPVGTPMAVAEPMTTGEQASAMVADAMSIVRRHPRLLIAAVTIWVLIFGSSAVMHLVSSPPLPSAATASAAPSSIITSQQQSQDLEDLAERARKESAEADAEMAQLMREDALAAQREAAAQARADRLAAAAARRAQKSGAKPSGARTGRHIVRVMPTTATI